MKKIGLFMILALSMGFGEDFSFDDFQTVQQKQKIQSNLLRYISVDLSAIPHLQGIVNLGLRKEGEKNGFDLGISTGKGKNVSQTFLYGSFLKFIDASETAKYYTGMGARSGGAAWPGNSVFETTGAFSAGRSYLTPSGIHQFFEMNLYWPHFYHFQYPVNYKNTEYSKKYKKRFSNYRNIQFAVFYGWFF